MLFFVGKLQEAKAEYDTAKSELDQTLQELNEM